MLLGGKEYNTENINSIQVKELKSERVFRPTANGVTNFISKHSPLSNHHPAKIKADGHVFHSSAQYFMYLKAKHFKDVRSVEKIKHAKTPAEVKDMGKKVENFDKKSWHTVADDAMYKAMYPKFS